MSGLPGEGSAGPVESVGMVENAPGPPADEWLTVAQVMVLVGLSDSRVQRLLREGRIPARKVGRDWIVSRRSVEDFLALPPGSPGHPRAVRGQAG